MNRFSVRSVMVFVLLVAILGTLVVGGLYLAKKSSLASVPVKVTESGKSITTTTSDNKSSTGSKGTGLTTPKPTPSPTPVTTSPTPKPTPAPAPTPVASSPSPAPPSPTPAPVAATGNSGAQSTGQVPSTGMGSEPILLTLVVSTSVYFAMVIWRNRK